MDRAVITPVSRPAAARRPRRAALQLELNWRLALAVAVNAALWAAAITAALHMAGA